MLPLEKREFIDVYRRVTESGYSAPMYWGENVLAGLSIIQASVDRWMGSPDHCANIMHVNYKEIGLACMKSTSGMMHWTLDFGAR